MAMSNADAGDGGIDEENGADTRPLELAVDELCDTLASAPRRHVVDVVADLDGGVSIEELAEALPDAVGDEELTVATLYHLHLPKLAANGVVEYDQQSGMVRPAKHTDSCQFVLDAMRTHCRTS